MNKYEYKVLPFSTTVPLLEQINAEGSNGWRFLMMAQEIDNRHVDFKTGRPAVKMTLIYEKSIRDNKFTQFIDSYPDTTADGYVFCGKCGKKLEI